MTPAVYLTTQDQGGHRRAGWLILESLPRFVKEDGNMDQLKLIRTYGVTVRATINVSGHEYRRYASGRFLG
jgi:hypothetical protein